MQFKMSSVTGYSSKHEQASTLLSLFFWDRCFMTNLFYGLSIHFAFSTHFQTVSTVERKRPLQWFTDRQTYQFVSILCEPFLNYFNRMMKFISFCIFLASFYCSVWFATSISHIYPGITEVIPLEASPYQALLETRLKGGRRFCLGTIIHEKWILTAAHCIRGYLSISVSVFVGPGNPVVRYVVEPSVYAYIYNLSDVDPKHAYNYDLGLLKLKQPFVLGEESGIWSASVPPPDDSDIRDKIPGQKLFLVFPRNRTNAPQWGDFSSFRVPFIVKDSKICSANFDAFSIQLQRMYVRESIQWHKSTSRLMKYLHLSKPPPSEPYFYYFRSTHLVCALQDSCLPNIIPTHAAGGGLFGQNGELSVYGVFSYSFGWPDSADEAQRSAFQDLGSKTYAFPSIFIRVSRFSQWINAVIARDEKRQK